MAVALLRPGCVGPDGGCTRRSGPFILLFYVYIAYHPVTDLEPTRHLRFPFAVGRPPRRETLPHVADEGVKHLVHLRLLAAQIGQHPRLPVRHDNVDDDRPRLPEPPRAADA